MEMKTTSKVVRFSDETCAWLVAILQESHDELWDRRDEVGKRRYRSTMKELQMAEDVITHDGEAL